MPADIKDAYGGVDQAKVNARVREILDAHGIGPAVLAELVELTDEVADVAYEDGYHDGKRGAYRSFDD